MRDAKLFFRENEAATVASGVVDLGSSQPGIGKDLYLSATFMPQTITGDVTVTLSTSDTSGGTYADIAVLTITPEYIERSGNLVMISAPLPPTCKRFAKTAWTGITGIITDGIDWGLMSGYSATHFTNI